MPVVEAASVPAKPSVDVQKHLAALRDLGGPIGRLRGLLVSHRTLLMLTPGDAPCRRSADRWWDTLASEMHTLLRDAYSHMALIATADPPLAWGTFDAVVGTGAAWEEAGMRRLVGYWKNRQEPAHWLTPEDLQALYRARIPAAFDAGLAMKGREA